MRKKFMLFGVPNEMTGQERNKLADDVMRSRVESLLEEIGSQKFFADYVAKNYGEVLPKGYLAMLNKVEGEVRNYAFLNGIPGGKRGGKQA